jgi:hypothetical protein
VTARIAYTGYVQPMAEVVLNGADEHGRASVRVPLNNALAITYTRAQDIKAHIMTLLAAQELLEHHQDALDAHAPLNGAGR